MRKFQVDPKLQMALAFLVGAITFLGANALPQEVPARIAGNIKDWSIYLGQFYLVVVAPLLLAYTNSNPGPLAPPDSPAVQAVKAKEDVKP